MSVSIFVMTHKAYDEPADPIYRSLQVGRAQTGTPKDLKYMGDDTGDNISAENWLYGELTGIYWLYKNYREDDIIGICHYRRFFVHKDGSLFSERDYENILSEYDIITSNANMSSLTIRDAYGRSHNIADLIYCGEAIKKLYPQYLSAFETVLDSHRCCYANLCVMSHRSFDAYCEWMFSVIFEAAKSVDVSDYDSYHKRVFGFVSEILLNVWIEKNALKVYEARIGISGEKVETVELKNKIAKCIKKGDYSAGRKAYYDMLKKRPDVRLAQSDISGELPKLEVILYIMEQEQQNEIRGFSEVSREVPGLIRHFDRTVDILRAIGRGKAGEDDISYILSTNVSAIAAEVILRNSAGINGDVVRKVLGINI